MEHHHLSVDKGRCFILCMDTVNSLGYLSTLITRMKPSSYHMFQCADYRVCSNNYSPEGRKLTIVFFTIYLGVRHSKWGHHNCTSTVWGKKKKKHQSKPFVLVFFFSITLFLHTFKTLKCISAAMINLHYYIWNPSRNVNSSLIFKNLSIVLKFNLFNICLQNETAQWKAVSWMTSSDTYSIANGHGNYQWHHSLID